MRIVKILCGICLTISLLAVGFVVCIQPIVTEQLARALDAKDGIVVFNNDQLTRAAVATRQYTIDDANIEPLQEVILRINQEQKTPYANLGAMTLLTVADDRYVLDYEAISHLKDVYGVVCVAKPALAVIAIATLALLIALAISRRHRRSVSTILIASPIALIAILVGLGVWAVLDFYTFFNAFHSLFFADGSWFFSYTSLLISMYPEEFWIGMAIIWAVSSFIACIICMAIGIAIKKRKKRHHD